MEVFSSKQAPSLMKFKDLCTLSRLLLNEDFEEAKELVFRCRKRIEAASPSLFSKEYLDVQRSRRKSKDVKAPEGSRHPSTESPGNMRGGPDANIQEHESNVNNADNLTACGNDEEPNQVLFSKKIQQFYILLTFMLLRLGVELNCTLRFLLMRRLLLRRAPGHLGLGH